jgi:hypothetical protein
MPLMLCGDKIQYVRMDEDIGPNTNREFSDQGNSRLSAVKFCRNLNELGFVFLLLFHSTVVLTLGKFVLTG